MHRSYLDRDYVKDRLPAIDGSVIPSPLFGCNWLLLIFLDPFVYTPFKIIQELIVNGIQHTCRKITKRERDKRAPHREKSKFRLY